MEKRFNDEIKLIKEIAYKSIENFYKILDISNVYLENVYNIPIIINDKNSDMIAEYQPIDNTITLYTNHIVNQLEYSETIHEKEIILLDAALSIIHEIIHANRTVFINNGLNIVNGNYKFKQEQIKKMQLNKQHDINQYRLLLSDMLNNNLFKSFETYIPVKVKRNDNTYYIIAYNRQTKNFDEFITKELNINDTNLIDDYSLLYEIGIELNNKNNNYTLNDIIYTFIKKDLSDEFLFSLVACDYYHDHLDKDIAEINNFIKLQNRFEEIITESLATIIIMSRNKSIIDLKNICNKIELSDSSDFDIKMGVKLIRIMGIDMIKWFLTIAYHDYYFDYFKDKFKDKYIYLLELYSDIFLLEDNDFTYQKQIENILYEKIKKM